MKNTLVELKNNNWVCPFAKHTIRQFKNNLSFDSVKFLFENYIDNFAFSFKYGGVKYSAIKYDGKCYLRNDDKLCVGWKGNTPNILTTYDVCGSLSCVYKNLKK